MASKKKVIEMITLVKGQWGYFGKDVSAEVLVNFWGTMLKDIPDDICEIAFLNCMRKCHDAPAPADILDEVKGMVKSTEPSDEQLWSQLVKTLDKVYDQWTLFPYDMIQPNGKTQGQNARDRVEKMWNELPYQIQQFVGSKGELIRMARCSEDDLKFEKNRFLKSMPDIQKRQEYTELLEGHNIDITMLMGKNESLLIGS